MQTLRHVVCGTDFSEHAEHALELAGSIARATTTAITLVHVCDVGVDGHDDQHAQHCGDALSAWVAKYRHRSVEIVGVLRFGRPWTKLDNVAVELGASLIVIGRHGAGGGHDPRLGSVARQLVSGASRPVLTVPNHFGRLISEAHEINAMHRKNPTP